jgi:4-amino-4-deoxy-L-arabinose transferase-like glycosyltransferase
MNALPPDAPSPRLLANPPGGLALLCWVALFLLLGSIGHDPWKGDDATHFGVVWSMVKNGLGLVPRLAGEAHLDYPPLYYWLSAGMTDVLGWLLSPPDAARLATAACAGVMLACVGLCAQRWHGLAANTPAVLLALGSLGFMMHSHETQPLMAITAFAAIGYLGFAWLDRRPVLGGLLAALSLSGLFLSGALVACLLLAPLWILAPACLGALRQRPALIALAGSALGAGLIMALYGLALHQADSALFARALETQWHKLMPRADTLSRLGDFHTLGQRAREWAKLFAWFTWPAWPLAGWSLWTQRRHLREPALRLPLLYLLLALGVVLLFSDMRSASFLPLLAPLALIAVAGLHSLRRGAANALDWFAMMTFSLLGLAAWFTWNTLASGQPARYAASLARFSPDFVFQFSFAATALAFTLSLSWVWMLINSPRSRLRGLTHWAAGVILLWGLCASLLQPWVDQGKSYRPVVESLQAALRTLPQGCIASRGLGTSQRASLDYFADLITHSGDEAEARCSLLLVQQDGTAHPPTLPAPWTLRWQGSRAGDRHESFRLYVRS